MIGCCEKVFNGVSSNNCKKFSVVKENSLDKIVYYQIFGCSEFSHKNKKIAFIEGFGNTLFNRDAPLTIKKFNTLKQLINKFYFSLQKKNREHLCLVTTSKACVNHLDINVNCSHGILLEDESIILFNDFSLDQQAYFESMIKRGGL